MERQEIIDLLQESVPKLDSIAKLYGEMPMSSLDVQEIVELNDLASKLKAEEKTEVISIGKKLAESINLAQEIREIGTRNTGRFRRKRVRLYKTAEALDRAVKRYVNGSDI